MGDQFPQSHSAKGSRTLSYRDVILVVVAVAGVVLANVGVVRALDVALDAIHAEK